MFNFGRSSKESKNHRVEFEYFAPHALSVYVAGSFNGWDPLKTPLKRDREGRWKAALTLKPGRYEYRYWVDHSWENDQRPVECIPNAFGTWNCVIVVR